jgi:hypothetical protein
MNMLARLEMVVSEVFVDCPAGVPIAGRISPLFLEGVELDRAVAAALAEIDTVPMTLSPQRGDLRLVIGPGPVESGTLRVYGEGWCGGISLERELPEGPQSSLPFGPLLAASLAVAEVFRASLLDLDRFPAVGFAFYSTWSHQVLSEARFDGPAAIDHVKLSEVLVGAGAVGVICAMCLWATEGLLGTVDLIDHDLVDETNLNRYLLFDKRHVGLHKVNAAVSLLGGSGIHFEPHDVQLEVSGLSISRGLCAVDRNNSKAAVQNHWPESLLMATTRDLRAELVRCDPRLGGPCARCYNQPEDEGVPDDDLRARFRSMTPEEQVTFAESANASVEDARRWAELGECGTSGDRVRDALREDSGPMAAFAVGFVSCAAGVMLGAEAVKEAMGATTPLSTSLPRASLQFFSPHRSPGAAHYPRDSLCPMCVPGEPGAEEWGRRVSRMPSRQHDE